MTYTFILAFIALLSSGFFPTVAKAYDIETPEQYFDILQHKLTSLHVAVEIDDYTICNSRAMLAAYQFARKTLVLCRIAFSTMDVNDEITKLETITHELVHLAQDCKDGLRNRSASNLFSRENHLFMVDHLSNEKLIVLEDSYKSSDWALEVEAFYLENRPLRVLELLDQVCFDGP